MSKLFSIKACWIFVLVIITPGAMIMAEEPSATRDQAIREAQPAAAAGGEVAQRPEFRLFRPLLAPPARAEGQKIAAAAYGIVSTAATAGGKFTCVGASGEAYLGWGDYGILGSGSDAGGYFVDSDGTAATYVAYGDTGIHATGASYGIMGFGNTAGGYFEDSDSSGYANVGFGDVGVEGHGSYGIRGYGSFAGGYFDHTSGTGYAYLAYGDYGVEAQGTYGIRGYGSTMGGFFDDTNGSGYANVANGDTGILAYGSTMGGYFKDSDGSGYSNAGEGDFGIRSYGNTAGGYFKDIDHSGYAYVGYGDYGIEARGSVSGGYFANTDGTSSALLGSGSYGVEGYGAYMGGYFSDTDGTGLASLAYGDYGVEASGTYGIRGFGSTMGGYFKDSDSSGYSNVGEGDIGIRSYGNGAGGTFEELDGSGYAYVAYDGIGIEAGGNFAGGWFLDLDNITWAFVGASTYKITGTGAVSFVQNHPYDRDSVIVYAAPEGDEVATYTRGTARLVGGEARVPLGETFKWVTNPDIGLTTYLTPVGEWSDLYVAERTTEEIVVRSAGGAQDGAFDYMIYGLRIGFEESSIVQEKELESYIPSMADHRQLYERRPDLKAYNSLERFKGMRRVVGQKDEIDLSRAQALRDAIIEFDPAIHDLPGLSMFDEMTGEDARGRGEGDGEGVQGHERVRATRADHDRRLASDHPSLSASIPVDDEGNVYATSFRPSSQDLASLLEVSEAVDPGDVLVIDRSGSGMMRRAAEAADTGVVGVVAASPGVVLGMESPGRTPAGQRPLDPDAEPEDHEPAAGGPALRAPVAFSGIVRCKVDAGYGAVWPGDLLVTSPTPGHAMRDEMPLPGTVLGKALEPLEEGTGTIRVLVMLR